MSPAPKVQLSPAEYLARERNADFKSEFYRGEAFAVAGASYEHNAIKDNLIGLLFNALRESPCRTLSSDMRVWVDATGLYTYPDVIVVCGHPQFEDANVDTLLNPQVILEVLSDSTAAYDRGPKFAQYRQVPPLREYVLVSPDRPLVERFVRQPDNTWLLTEFADLDGEFALTTVPARMPLADVYRGVELPETPLR